MITKLHTRYLKKPAPKEKKRRLRDDLIIIRTPADNEKGYKDEWVYAGPLLVWKNPDAQKRITAICILMAAQLLLTIVGSLQWFSANWFMAVTTCRLLSVIPLLFQLIGAVELFVQRKKIQKRDFSTIHNCQCIAPWFSVLLLGACLIAQIWAMTQLFDTGAIIAAVLTVAAAACAAANALIYRGMEAVSVRNTAKDGYKELNDKTTGRATGIYVPRHQKR